MFLEEFLRLSKLHSEGSCVRHELLQAIEFLLEICKGTLYLVRDLGLSWKFDSLHLIVFFDSVRIIDVRDFFYLIDIVSFVCFIDVGDFVCLLVVVDFVCLINV